MTNKIENIALSKLQKISILEYFEDGDIEEIDNLLKTYENSAFMKTLLLMKNYDQRTILHLICLKGHVSLLMKILPLYKKYKISLDPLDENGDTPLLLVSSHGYDHEVDYDLLPNDKIGEEKINKFLNNKFQIISELLKFGADIKKSVIKKKNNPLHWAIYYGDYQSALAIFTEYPMIILKTNKYKQTPLEILFQKNLKRISKLESKKIAGEILTQFTKSFFLETSDEDFLDIFKNSNEKERNQFKILTTIKKKHSNIFDTNDLIQKIRSQHLNLVNKLFSTNTKPKKAEKLFPQLMKKKLKNQEIKNAPINPKLKIKKSNSENNLNMNYSHNLENFNVEENENLEKKDLENHDDTPTPDEEHFQESRIVHDYKKEEINIKQDSKVKIQTSLLKNDKIDSVFPRINNLKNFKDSINDNDTSLIHSQNNSSRNSQSEFGDNKQILEFDPKVEIKIYDEKKKEVKENKSIKFMHKILMISIYIQNHDLIKILIDSFMLSPFVISINKMSGIQFACLKGYKNIVNFFINANFKYYQSHRIFDISEIINSRDGIEFNTSLHFACQQKNIDIFKMLIEKQGDINIYNYKDFRPLELTKKSDFVIYEKYLFEKLENEALLKDIPNPLLNNSIVELSLENLNTDYIYLIATHDVEQDFKKTLVYKQLNLVKQKWKNDIKIKHIVPLVEKKKYFFRHYFLIKLERNLIESLAEFLGFSIFNNKRGYITKFMKNYSKEYDNFRDFHIHELILFLLNSEFNVEHYLQKGIIETHFPIHEFRTRNNIKKNWNKEKRGVFFDPWKFSKNKKDLRPFNSLAFYFGCDKALYISFVVLMISFLIILCFSAILLSAIAYFVFDEKSDNRFTIVYAIIMSIWVVLVVEKWKRRENEHAQIWNSKNYKENQTERINYKGDFEIDKITKKKIRKNKLSTTKRRMITEIPLMLLGAAIIICIFVIFITCNKSVSGLTQEETNQISYGKFNHNTTIAILKALVGAMNGVLIFIFSEIYRLLSEIVVSWENHKYETDRQNSFIVKTFVFNFFISYTNLFYYAFIEKNFQTLSSNFFSIMISTNLMFFLKMNLIPFLLYKFKKRLFIKKWNLKRKEIKRKLYEKHNLLNSAKNFDQMNEPKQKLILKIEKDIILQEQIELTLIMPEPPNQIELWKNTAIQFGFISFFSIAFPLATIWGLIVSVFHVYSFYYSFTNNIKRTHSKERSSIGVWKYILQFMVFASLVSNSCILAFTSSSVKKLFYSNPENKNYEIFSFFVLIEHLCFIVVFALYLIVPNKPGWVENEISNSKFKKNLYNDKIRKKMHFHKTNKKKEESINFLRKNIKPKVNGEKLRSLSQDDFNEFNESDIIIHRDKKEKNKSIFKKF